MSAIDIQGVLNRLLPGFEDENVFEYLCSVIEGMSLEERRSGTVLSEVLSPFLVDSGYSDNEESANEICKKISIEFGGSGYKKSSGGTISNSSIESVESPQLLSAPLKIAEQSASILNKKKTYGGAVLAKDSASVSSSDSSNRSNSAFDAGAIATTQKQIGNNRLHRNGNAGNQRKRNH